MGGRVDGRVGGWSTHAWREGGGPWHESLTVEVFDEGRVFSCHGRLPTEVLTDLEYTNDKDACVQSITMLHEAIEAYCASNPCPPP